MSPDRREQAQVRGLPRHVVGVAGVVIDGERALSVLRRSPARWELPGGALEAGEQVVDALRREVREETGLGVEPVRLSGIYQNMSLGPVALVFWCRRVDGSERLSDETSDWRWISRDDASALLPPAWAVRFTDALDLAAGRQAGPAPLPTVRVHDGTHLL